MRSPELSNGETRITLQQLVQNRKFVHFSDFGTAKIIEIG